MKYLFLIFPMGLISSYFIKNFLFENFLHVFIFDIFLVKVFKYTFII